MFRSNLIFEYVFLFRPMFTGGPQPPQNQPPPHIPPPQQQQPQVQGPMSQMNFTGDMPNYEEGNVIRNREIMYRLIISQLFYDGYSQAAIQLTNILAVDPPAPPSERLLHVLVRGLDQEAEENEKKDFAIKKEAFADVSAGPSSRTEILENLQSRGLNLEFDTESRQGSHDIVPEPAMYETAYVTSHKANCRAGAFNMDGSLVRYFLLDNSR